LLPKREPHGFRFHQRQIRFRFDGLLDDLERQPVEGITVVAEPFQPNESQGGGVFTTRDPAPAARADTRPIRTGAFEVRGEEPQIRAHVGRDRFVISPHNLHHPAGDLKFHTSGKERRVDFSQKSAKRADGIG